MATEKQPDKEPDADRKSPSETVETPPVDRDDARNIDEKGEPFEGMFA